MTTEKKATPKVTSTVTVKSEPVPKTARRTGVRRTTVSKTTVTKTPVKRTATKTATILNKADSVKVLTAKQTDAEKKVKLGKMKMARDSFTMPKEEYAQLALLKTRLSELGQPVKKSELLRAGVKLLVAMTDARLKATMATIPVIKTGRPNKKK